MSHVAGDFDVKLTPQERARLASARLVTLDATSKGEMLAANTEVKGSAGYVAIERVTGTLAGRSGTFVLQHNATMDRGAPSLNIIVVPDSGTAELAALKGKMNIIIAADGKHSYEFDYELSEAET